MRWIEVCPHTVSREGLAKLRQLEPSASGPKLQGDWVQSPRAKDLINYANAEKSPIKILNDRVRRTSGSTFQGCWHTWRGHGSPPPIPCSKRWVELMCVTNRKHRNDGVSLPGRRHKKPPCSLRTYTVRKPKCYVTRTSRQLYGQVQEASCQQPACNWASPHQAFGSL